MNEDKNQKSATNEFLFTLKWEEISLFPVQSLEAAKVLFLSRNRWEMHVKSDHTGGHRMRTETSVNKLLVRNGL